MATADWTDARLNDAFEALRADNAQMREEMRTLRTEMRADMAALRSDMSAEMAALRAGMHADIRMFWVTLVASYVSLVAALVVTRI